MPNATGPVVDFVVVSKRWQKRIAEGQVPTVGANWVVDGQMCVVRRVVELGPGRLRVWVEPDASYVIPNPSLSIFTGALTNEKKPPTP